MSDQGHSVALHVEQSLYGSSQDQFLRGEDDLTVAELIPQILAERKSFLNITEQLLQDEIDSKNRDADEGDSASYADNQEDTEDEPESAFQLFQKHKADLLTNVNSALNETSLSLDFVSLLISAERPNIAKSTISAHLAKAAPLGSLGSDRLRRTQDSAQANSNKAKSRESIGMGWKYQTLSNITGLFKTAGAQLREEVQLENEYWTHINRVLNHGEVLFKTRDPITNGRAIGVQYGYGDSGSSYYNKGHAVLHKESNGSILFCPVLPGRNAVSKMPNKFTRVRILSKIDDDFMLTGQSVLEKEALTRYADDPLINDIQKARYFLFEEDLFYHLVREAKNLINYNVTMISNKIIIDLVDQIIELESVVYDENNEEEMENVYQNINDESSKNNSKAQDILCFLKLMLCCYYNYNLELKQKIPTSFTKWKQNNSHPLLLRPLIGHTRHQMNLQNMHGILQRLSQDLDASTVTHEIEEVRYKNLAEGCRGNPFKKAVEKPLSTLVLSLCKLKTQEYLKLEVEVTTSEIFVNLLVHLSATKYKSQSDMHLNQDGCNILLLTFTDLFDVEESVSWTLQNFLSG